MFDKSKIHKDSEIWKYEGVVDFTEELVNFFEAERKHSDKERKNDARHLTHESLDWDSTITSVKDMKMSVEDQVIFNIFISRLCRSLNLLTETEKRRYILKYILGYKIVEIAKIEDVSKVTIKYSLNSAENKIRSALFKNSIM